MHSYGWYFLYALIAALGGALIGHIATTAIHEKSFRRREAQWFKSMKRKNDKIKDLQLHLYAADVNAVENAEALGRVRYELARWFEMVPERPTNKTYGPGYGQVLPGKNWELGVHDAAITIKIGRAHV